MGSYTRVFEDQGLTNGCEDNGKMGFSITYIQNHESATFLKVWDLAAQIMYTKLNEGAYLRVRTSCKNGYKKFKIRYMTLNGV